MNHFTRPYIYNLTKSKPRRFQAKLFHLANSWRTWFCISTKFIDASSNEPYHLFHQRTVPSRACRIHRGPTGLQNGLHSVTGISAPAETNMRNAKKSVSIWCRKKNRQIHFWHIRFNQINKPGAIMVRMKRVPGAADKFTRAALYSTYA